MSSPAVSPAPALPLWRGRALALLGILLVAFNLRAAVTAISPIAAEIGESVTLTGAGLGLLGMLPQICFALFGLLAPRLTRRASLEAVLVVALGAMLLGDLLRALAPDYLLLVLGSAIVFAGMAVGNVLLPPLVKRYFPDRVSLVTAVYATVMSVSTLLPPLIAVPVADAEGWRLSLGMWGALAVLAVLPWTGLLLARRAAPPVSSGGSTGDPVAPAGVAALEAEAELVAPVAPVRGVWRSPLAWSLAVLFAVSSLNAYALFAWLPQLLDDMAGTSPEAAGALLSLYGGIGIPASIIVPWAVSRLRSVGPIIAVAFGCFVVGDLGLILVPATATWLWVLLAGLGPLLFPLMLILINRRSRTPGGSVALSGFVQGVGYVFGSLGPLTVGLLHDASGGWLWPELFLLATAAAILVFGPIGARPVFIEDQLAAQAARRAHP